MRASACLHGSRYSDRSTMIGAPRSSGARGARLIDLAAGEPDPWTVGVAIKFLRKLTRTLQVRPGAPEEWIRLQLPQGDLLAPMSPQFLSGLGDKLRMRDDGIDVLLAASGLPGSATLQDRTAAEHPRVTRANAHRENIRVFTDVTGAATVILGHGLALRHEIAIEIEPSSRGQGLAARTLTEARRLVDPDEVLFAQTAPGNAASLRALLAAGFRPIGSEVLFFSGEPAA